jgi:hypothetical protein
MRFLPRISAGVFKNLRIFVRRLRRMMMLMFNLTGRNKNEAKRGRKPAPMPIHSDACPFQSSAEFKKNTKPAARVAPFDITGGGANHPARAAFQAAIDSDFHVALVIEAIAAGWTGVRQR